VAIKPERLTTSVTLKLIFILVVFLGVPLLIYARFAESDSQRQILLVENLRLQGQLAASTLRQEIANAGERAVDEAQDLINDLSLSRIRVRLLLRPAGKGEVTLAASGPSVPAELAAPLVSALLAVPELDRMTRNCAGRLENIREVSPPEQEAELVRRCRLSRQSMAAGCGHRRWRERPATSELTPFLSTAEVQFAIVIYLFMAVIATWVGGSIWESLRSFGELATQLSNKGERATSRFVDVTPVKELLPTAAAIDRLVETMRRAAEAIREASEENAHALKGAVATIRQAMEPLQSEEHRGQAEALQVIERSLSKLDGLIAATQRSEQDLATSITEGQQPIDLGELVRNSVRALAEQQIDSGAVRLACEATPNLSVLGSEEAIETIVENLLDNAIGFAPPGSTVQVSVSRHGNDARLAVTDQGAGVPVELLASIFDRHFSTRLATDPESGTPHFGLGLAIVRRNVALLGGSVFADNLHGGGFRVTVDLPLANAKA
jgi:two-component system sensor histidine kinase ChvG